MRGSATIAVFALVVLLFASVGVNGWLAYERETAREQIDEARRYGFLPETERPGCGWVKVPRCENCGRFHAPPPTIFPGPAPLEVHPRPGPRIEVFPFPGPLRGIRPFSGAIEDAIEDALEDVDGLPAGDHHAGGISDDGETLLCMRLE